MHAVQVLKRGLPLKFSADFTTETNHTVSDAIKMQQTQTPMKLKSNKVCKVSLMQRQDGSRIMICSGYRCHWVKH